MNNPSIFREIEQGNDLLQLEPGLYRLNCHENLISETCEAYSSCKLSPETLSAFFSGVLLPFFLHNINNLMVGVMGNLDLAGMFMPDMEKVAPKLEAARSATGSVVDFIRDISQPPSSLGTCEIAADDFRRVFTTLKAACGRSVSTEGLDKLDLRAGTPCSDPLSLLNVLWGMGVWSVLCMGGNGSLDGQLSENLISLSWKRPPEAGKSHMPGPEKAPSVLAITGRYAVSSGYRLMVENWCDSSGTVILAY